MGLQRSSKMFVIYLENYKESLRGKLKMYLYEIKPALYVGTTSARIRDMIWNTMIVREKDINAVLIFQDKNEQGFSVMTIGETKRNIQDFNGLFVVTRGSIMNKKILKSKKSDKQLISHFYETAAVSECLINGYFNNLINQISAETGEELNNLKQMVMFFSFIHDIGKVHPAFQYKLIADVLDDFGYEYSLLYDGFRHEVYSEKILNKFFSEKFKGIASRNIIMSFVKAVKCHHQGKPTRYCALPEDIRTVWETIQTEIIEEGLAMFPFKESKTVLKEVGNGIFELLVGIINTADWLASTQNVFDNKEICDFSTSKDYFDYLKKQCMLFLENNMMDSTTLEELFGEDDIWKLLIGEYSPRPMQATVEGLVSSMNEPSLLFVEDSCGGGKTEAAMYYALSQVKNASGIYFALPTTATSENMRIRVDGICKNGIGTYFKVPVYNSMAWMQGDDVKLDNNLWQNDNKLKLFYPIAVGTVDQLLMTVQGIKYSDLGLVALSNKVLIIDEMHAYDAYMLEELKTLFSYCSLMGVSIIVLSATLTTETKKQLIMAYNRANNNTTVQIKEETVTYKNINFSQEYPLVTKVTKKSIVEEHVQSSSNKEYKYDIFEVDSTTQNETIFKQVDNLIKDGGTVAVVLNTVAQAIEAYQYISNAYEHSDVDVGLLHSRFSLTEKCNKTNEILSKYGKIREGRPAKSVLISTQIIEQSLDVDFDYMITELAPIDFVIQRFGRIRRHNDRGTIRELRKLDGPSAFVFYNTNKFGKSSYVYEESILKATKDYLCKKSSIVAPNDIREAIEFVYHLNNINILKQTSMSQKADLVSIGGVCDRNFWRFVNLVELRNDPHTRLESTPSTNIILLEEEQIGATFSNEEIKEIIKTQMYSSIPLKKIGELDCIKTGNKILDEYQIYPASKFNLSSELGLII